MFSLCWNTWFPCLRPAAHACHSRPRPPVTGPAEPLPPLTCAFGSCVFCVFAGLPFMVSGELGLCTDGGFCRLLRRPCRALPGLRPLRGVPGAFPIQFELSLARRMTSDFRLKPGHFCMTSRDPGSQGTGFNWLFLAPLCWWGAGALLL